MSIYACMSSWTVSWCCCFAAGVLCPAALSAGPLIPCKPCCAVSLQELWSLELKSQAEFDAATASLPAGKMLVVDYYAPWCAVCKVSAGVSVQANRPVETGCSGSTLTSSSCSGSAAAPQMNSNTSKQLAGACCLDCHIGIPESLGISLAAHD